MDTFLVLALFGFGVGAMRHSALHVLLCRPAQARRRRAGWYLSPLSAALMFLLGFGFLKAVDLLEGGNAGGSKVGVWATLIWLLGAGVVASGFWGVLVVGSY